METEFLLYVVAAVRYSPKPPNVPDFWHVERQGQECVCQAPTERPLKEDVWRSPVEATEAEDQNEEVYFYIINNEAG